MQRPLLWLALLHGAGIVTGSWAGGTPALVATLTALAALLGLLPIRLNSCLLLCAFYFAGWTHYLMASRPVSPDDLRLLVGSEPRLAQLFGVVQYTPQLAFHEPREGHPSLNRVLVQAQKIRLDESWKPARGLVLVRGPFPENSPITPGRIVDLNGVIAHPSSPKAPGQFDEKAYLKHRRIYYQFRIADPSDWHVTPGTPPPAWFRLVRRFHRWARGSLSLGLDHAQPELRLLYAMTLGERGGLARSESKPFQISGTMHLFAISGLHVGFLAAIAIGAASMLRFPRVAKAGFVLVSVWAYTLLTGAQISAIRAAIMTTALLSGWAVKRPTDLLNSLGAAALAVTLWQPLQVFQIGFQLSFAVVACILILSRTAKRFLDRPDAKSLWIPKTQQPRWRPRFLRAKRGLLVLATTSAAAWIGSAPLVAFYFHLLSPAGFVLNLAVIPLAGLSLLSAFLSLATVQFVPQAAVLFNHAAWFFTHNIAALTQATSEIPGTFFRLPPPRATTVAACYIAVAILACERWSWRRRLALALITTGLALAHGLAVWLPGRRETRITILPVRRGDAIYVHTPRRFERSLIDGGTQEDAQRLVLPFFHSQGLDQIAQLILSHGDKQHVGGVRIIYKTLRPAVIIVPAARYRSRYYNTLLDQLRQTAPTVAFARTSHHLGLWSVKYPLGPQLAPRADDATLVLQSRIHGVTLTLLSDLSRAGQRELFNRQPEMKTDVLLMGYPSPSQPPNIYLLTRMAPQVLVVTGGAYAGSSRWLRELRRDLKPRGATVLATMESGAITLYLSPRRKEIRTMSGERILLAPRRARE